ncbi:hypothetical protein Leryth_009262 [Lithospermum erythrorhizon]|nr:hypothetical protein Leryth_009262 [Lithospermum erythrorhizon]
MMMRLVASICSIFVVTFCCAAFSLSDDTLNITESISINQTLISAKEEFKLGFFSPNNSGKFYLGIWYNRIPVQTIVWVANRDTPLSDSFGVAKLENDGNFIVQDGEKRVLWSTKIKGSRNNNTVAQLLDSGNLVLRDANDQEVGSFLWQSFDHPSHAWIAGMTLGEDRRTSVTRNITSWRGMDDPSPGEYTFGFDLEGLAQATIWKGSSKHLRSGPWNGADFGGSLVKSKLPFTPQIIINSDEVYYGYSVNEESGLVMVQLSYTGLLQTSRWDNNSNEWKILQSLPEDDCGLYNFCGPNSLCNTSNVPLCDCLLGYEPKDRKEWDARIWSGGCKRLIPLNCTEDEGFMNFDGLKMPDLLQYSLNMSISLDQCRTECLKNCSCTAYADSGASGAGHGCLHWYEEIIDVRKLNGFPSQILYLRVIASDLVPESHSKKENKTAKIVLPIAATILLLFLVAICFIWKKKKSGERVILGQQVEGEAIRDEENLDLPFFNFDSVSEATQGFSDRNKLGEGGFGPVYKGVLSNGQEVAIKRQSETSSQGLNEWKNEVTLIAKLQHRNLVRLLGCCIHGQERMLIYEYMHNGSLDSYIFSDSKRQDKRHLLVWENRFSIIVGIARGLLYLHRDSRLRIIHRDLKASNVLLDIEMNPKISDFGTARTFGEKQLTTETRRVVGTYGYMAPEYVSRGIFSMKSDVFSFGVLVLEIVSGKRNVKFQHPDHEYNLLGHAWKLLAEGNGIELIDPLLKKDSCPISQVLRCIQVGLLCVQQRPDDRPTMSSVLMMLDSETSLLPEPKRPGFSTQGYYDSETDHSIFSGGYSSTNDVTNTIVQGR